MDERDIGKLREFHGHIGPYVIIGYRMGKRAERDLALKGHFDLRITVECSGAPPESCPVDGLQVSTGATCGKRNIVIVGDRELAVTIQEQPAGRLLRFALTGKAKTAIKGMPSGRAAVEPTALELAQWPDEDLFTIR